jgi:hypothetical protein
MQDYLEDPVYPNGDETKIRGTPRRRVPQYQHRKAKSRSLGSVIVSGFTQLGAHTFFEGKSVP